MENTKKRKNSADSIELRPPISNSNDEANKLLKSQEKTEERICNEESLWIIMQVCDSSFGGSLSHSAGLESAIAHGVVASDVDSIRQFIVGIIEQAENLLVPFLVRSFATACRSDASDTWIEDVAKIEVLANAMFSNEVTKRSSLNQGRCFLRIAVEAFGEYYKNINLISDSVQLSLRKARSNDAESVLQGHYVVMFGCFCGIVKLDIGTMLRMFFRVMTRDLVNAAARLSALGPLEGAKQQMQLSKYLESVVRKILAQGIDDLEPRQTHPFLEMIQSRHDILYSRLFNS